MASISHEILQLVLAVSNECETRQLRILLYYVSDIPKQYWHLLLMKENSQINTLAELCHSCIPLARDVQRNQISFTSRLQFEKQKHNKKF